MKKQTQEEFIYKSKNIFGDQLDYSESFYINSRTPIILICKIHGKFIIKPKDHISYKRGCNVCSGFEYDLDIFFKKSARHTQ